MYGQKEKSSNSGIGVFAGGCQSLEHAVLVNAGISSSVIHKCVAPGRCTEFQDTFMRQPPVLSPAFSKNYPRPLE